MALPIPNVKKVPKWALITAGGVTAGAVALKIFKNSPAGDAVASDSGSGAEDISTGTGFQYGSSGATGVIVPPVIMGGSDTSGSTDNAASLIDSIQVGNANVLMAQSSAYQGIFSDFSSNLGGVVDSAFGYAGGVASGAFGLAQGALDTATGVINSQSGTIQGLANANVDAINASTGVVNAAGGLVTSAGGLVNSAAGVLDAGGNLVNATAASTAAQGAANANILNGVGTLLAANAGPAPQSQMQNPSPVNPVQLPAGAAAPVAAQAPRCGGDYPNTGSDGGCYKVVCASGRGDAAKGRWHYYKDGRKLHVRDTC